MPFIEHYKARNILDIMIPILEWILKNIVI
jgi:hypothetical protein